MAVVCLCCSLLCLAPLAHRSIMRLLLGSRRFLPQTCRNAMANVSVQTRITLGPGEPGAGRRPDAFRRGGALRRNALAERGLCSRCREVDEASVAFKHQARRRQRQFARRTLDAPSQVLADGKGLDLPVR